MKATIVRGRLQRRPRHCDSVEDIREAEHWRNQVVRETTRKIAEIQNAGLGEHRIRDLNDEINRLLKEKYKWEEHIKGLGGPDYRASSSRIMDSVGIELAGHGGYKYFGAARDLPGVRDLFEKQNAENVPKRTRAQLFRQITPAYYGWRDEEDVDILLAEHTKELKDREEADVSYQATAFTNIEGDGQTQHTKPVIPLGLSGDPRRRSMSCDGRRHLTQSDNENRCSSLDALLLSTGTSYASSMGYRAYVAVPTARDIEKLILLKKKREISLKYLGEEYEEDRNTATTRADEEVPKSVEGEKEKEKGNGVPVAAIPVGDSDAKEPDSKMGNS